MRFDWLWQARFMDGTVICQPEDDKYSKHDDNADWNPSSFRDFLDYFDNGKNKLSSFGIVNGRTGDVVVVRFDNDLPYMFKYHKGDKDVVHIHSARVECFKMYSAQPIYYREMKNTVVDGVFGKPEVQAYVIGYQGQDRNGHNIQYKYRVPA